MEYKDENYYRNAAAFLDQIFFNKDVVLEESQ